MNPSCLFGTYFDDEINAQNCHTLGWECARKYSNNRDVERCIQANSAGPAIVKGGVVDTAQTISDLTTQCCGSVQGPGCDLGLDLTKTSCTPHGTHRGPDAPVCEARDSHAQASPCPGLEPDECRANTACHLVIG